jgi:hypothetical protein
MTRRAFSKLALAATAALAFFSLGAAPERPERRVRTYRLG